MSILVSALAFFLLLTLLILIHECGHFFAARKAKVTVEEFGFGIPPRATTLFFQGGTRFSLNWIPFGGFVRLKGENPETQRERTAPGSFAGASIPARIAILIAGVAMNFLFSILIFTLGFSVWKWVPTYVNFEEMKQASARGEITLQPGVLIGNLLATGTAVKAHVPAGSLLTAVDGKSVFIPEDVVSAQAGKKSVVYTVIPQNSQKPQTINVQVQNGKTGVELEFFPQVSSPRRTLLTGFLLSFHEARIMVIQTIGGIGSLFSSLLTRGRVPQGITGIVGIARITNQSVRAGWMTYLRLMAVLSLSLAILNILPFPALDGGRLLFVFIEGIRARPAPQRFEVMTNTVGFFILILLIVLITGHDILQFFSGT